MPPGLPDIYPAHDARLQFCDQDGNFIEPEPTLKDDLIHITMGATLLIILSIFGVAGLLFGGLPLLFDIIDRIYGPCTVAIWLGDPAQQDCLSSLKVQGEEQEQETPVDPVMEKLPVTVPLLVLVAIVQLALMAFAIYAIRLAIPAIKRAYAYWKGEWEYELVQNDNSEDQNEEGKVVQGMLPLGREHGDINDDEHLIECERLLCNDHGSTTDPEKGSSLERDPYQSGPRLEDIQFIITFFAVNALFFVTMYYIEPHVTGYYAVKILKEPCPNPWKWERHLTNCDLPKEERLDLTIILGFFDLVILAPVVFLTEAAVLHVVGWIGSKVWKWWKGGQRDEKKMDGAEEMTVMGQQSEKSNC